MLSNHDPPPGQQLHVNSPSMSRASNFGFLGTFCAQKCRHVPDQQTGAIQACTYLLFGSTLLAWLQSAAKMQLLMSGGFLDHDPRRNPYSSQESPDKKLSPILLYLTAYLVIFFSCLETATFQVAQPKATAAGVGSSTLSLLMKITAPQPNPGG